MKYLNVYKKNTLVVHVKVVIVAYSMVSVLTFCIVKGPYDDVLSDQYRGQPCIRKHLQQDSYKPNR